MNNYKSNSKTKLKQQQQRFFNPFNLFEVKVEVLMREALKCCWGLQLVKDEVVADIYFLFNFFPIQIIGYCSIFYKYILYVFVRISQFFYILFIFLNLCRSFHCNDQQVIYHMINGNKVCLGNLFCWRQGKRISYISIGRWVDCFISIKLRDFLSMVFFVKLSFI